MLLEYVTVRGSVCQNKYSQFQTKILEVSQDGALRAWQNPINSDYSKNPLRRGCCRPAPGHNTLPGPSSTLTTPVLAARSTAATGRVGVTSCRRNGSRGASTPPPSLRRARTQTSKALRPPAGPYNAACASRWPRQHAVCPASRPCSMGWSQCRLCLPQGPRDHTIIIINYCYCRYHQMQCKRCKKKLPQMPPVVKSIIWIPHIYH